MRELAELVEKLPLDLVLQIIPYTYHLQNKELLDDIKSYSETKTILSNYYYNYWIVSLEEPEDGDKYWLINNLFSFVNNYKPTMDGYVEQFYNIFKRNAFLETSQDIDSYILQLEKKNVTTQINIFLGLLTLEERNEFIGIHDL